MEKIKNNLITVFNMISYEPTITKQLVDFIQKYDGNDERGFLLTMMIVKELIMYVQKLEIKGETLDKIYDAHFTLESEIKKLKQDIEKSTTGDIVEIILQTKEDIKE